MVRWCASETPTTSLYDSATVEQCLPLQAGIIVQAVSRGRELPDLVSGEQGDRGGCSGCRAVLSFVVSPQWEQWEETRFASSAVQMCRSTEHSLACEISGRA